MILQNKNAGVKTTNEPVWTTRFPRDYLRIRDFEYAQPLYDLAYLLEVDALAKGLVAPKYRTFALWRAAYSFDGYCTLIDQWLDGEIEDQQLDYVPSGRIRTYLKTIRDSGTIAELKGYDLPQYHRVLRARGVRGLGPSQAAKLLGEGDPVSERWLNDAGAAAQMHPSELVKMMQSYGTWQAAHIVPPLIRVLHAFVQSGTLISSVDAAVDGIQPITQPFVVEMKAKLSSCDIQRVLAEQPFFSLKAEENNEFLIQHQLGWYFHIRGGGSVELDLLEWANAHDPLLENALRFKGDLHLHTSWSDGNASLADMAEAARKSSLEYIAVTDHSRSCKLQGGLTPAAWLRQASSISLNGLTLPILHGIEVDILEDGNLDLPEGLLAGMDIVVASVHSNWTSDEQVNTRRLLSAIESGQVDIIGHPTSAVTGKPGVPQYVRHATRVDWDSIFAACAKWMVALELNCFPSRLDLPFEMLARALDAGCWISLGSDAHSRSHLTHLQFGHRITANLNQNRILNCLNLKELKRWLSRGRSARARLPRTTTFHAQQELFADTRRSPPSGKITAFLSPTQRIPSGSKIVGLDLTAGKGKPTGVAVLDGIEVRTCSLETDDELIAFVRENRPRIVSIDSPLGFPGGGTEIDPSAGIVRVAEHDLSSVGIPAYPALIDSMKELTQRGVGLRKRIEALESPAIVIESYPGAAQDVLCIPRKQKSLELLRNGLRELGISGSGLMTQSHDEMDAITSAIVGRFYEAGEFLPMGVPAEAQLIVPRTTPIAFEPNPIICLTGRTGAGKSVVARYLTLFYGFEWIRTRDLIRELLIRDARSPAASRKYSKSITADTITDQDLRDFGLVILRDYQQEPLRVLLAEKINGHAAGIVIDAVRDFTDVEVKAIGKRPTFYWFIDSSEQAIASRLEQKTRIPSFTGRPLVNPIDQNAAILRAHCDKVLPNSGTLEDLRWRVDDSLFDMVSFCRKRSNSNGA